MKPKPVKRSRAPAYPTRAELLAREGVLESCLPRGWRAGRRLAGAVTFLAAANLTGCGDAPVTPPVQTPAGAETVLDRPKPSGLVVSSDAVAVVAPIFNHGEGHGATGCIVMSPPVFLSEEEAMQVIWAELRAHGIELKEGVAFEGLTVMPRVEPPDEDFGPSPLLEERQAARPLSMDGVDELNKVAVKFISRGDCRSLDVPAYFSSVQEYDSKGLARHVAEQIKQRGTQHVYAGVFYDPLVAVDFRRRAREAAEQAREAAEQARSPSEESPQEPGAADSKELLRRQAQDFVAWLEQQGVL